MFSQSAFSQELSGISDFTIRIDNQVVRYSKEKVLLAERWVLPFQVQKQEPLIEIVLEIPLLDPETEIELAKSGDFTIIDSLDFISENELRIKIRLSKHAKEDAVNINFKAITFDKKEKLIPIYLYPFAIPLVQWKTNEDELYIGEEKSFELNGLFLDEIEAKNLWISSDKFEYRIKQSEDRLRLFVLPRQLGSIEIAVPLNTKRFFKSQNGKLSKDLEVLQHKFNVKGGRLAFVTLDKNEIVAERGIGESIEIQIDKARNLPVRKTFRVEAQQEPGGKLIAEIFTRSNLANDKMLCWLKPYGYHRTSEGYLYIKDGDEPRFICNFNLIEESGISKVSILHEGSDWTENLQLNPGEKFDIRLEGKGLQRSKINLEGIEDWVKDSTASSDHILVFHARIPHDFNKRKISVLLNKKSSGFELSLKEFQVPRNLDFISVDFGHGYKSISDFNKAILVPNTIPNIVFKFSSEKIETINRFYGKQYLTMDINVYNNKRELMEYKRFENIVVCPGENSIRFPYYDSKDCSSGEISFNNQMSRKTQDLPDWGRVEVIVKSNSLKYNSIGFTQKLEIIQQRKYSFDIDISFPAGLLIQKLGEKGLGNLSGISTAIVGQFSFFKPEKIERYYPFKVGAGFIALNAFNFTEDSNRDVGLVALASVFPTKMNARFSFPLYLGFGYLLKDSKWFYILGPGIQVRF